MCRGWTAPSPPIGPRCSDPRVEPDRVDVRHEVAVVHLLQPIGQPADSRFGKVEADVGVTIEHADGSSVHDHDTTGVARLDISVELEPWPIGFALAIDVLGANVDRSSKFDGYLHRFTTSEHVCSSVVTVAHAAITDRNRATERRLNRQVGEIPGDIPVPGDYVVGPGDAL